METAFKGGFPNPHGWMAYWQDGTMFVKRAVYNQQAEFYDFGNSSECNFDGNFIELETLAPISKLEPGTSATHFETCELYGDVNYPESEDNAQGIVEQLELE